MVQKIINRIVHRPVAGLSVLVLITALAYGNTFRNDFIVDDHLFIADWPLIQDLNHWPQFFGPKSQPEGEEGVYSPLKTFFHALNYHWWGLNPFGYHLVALLIHLAGTAFVYRISSLLVGSRAVGFLAGLLFGLHPVHVEAVTFLTASIDTLGLVFLFISFYFYVQYRSGGCFRRNLYYSLFFATLAIFTHELAITLPLLIALYEFWLSLKSPLTKRYLRISPYFLLAFLYIGMKWVILGSVARGGYLYGSFYLTMLVIIKALARYVFILLYPAHLSIIPEISKGIYAVDWQYFDPQAVLSQSFWDFQVIGSFILTASIILLSVKLHKKEPLLAFCVGWFYICLIPVLNIVPSECYFAERYLYAGSLGFCLGLAIIINRFWHGRAQGALRLFIRYIGIIFMTGVLLFYFGRTVLRNMDWRSQLSFYQAEVKVNPRHPALQRDLGVVYLHLGQFNRALEHLQKAVMLRPLDQDAFFALGEAYMDLGKLSDAAANFKDAVNIDIDFAEAHYSLGRVYFKLGKLAESREHLKRSAALFHQQGKAAESKVAAQVFESHFGRYE